MQHDDVVWMVIGKGFCSFKARCVPGVAGRARGDDK